MMCQNQAVRPQLAPATATQMDLLRRPLDASHPGVSRSLAGTKRKLLASCGTFIRLNLYCDDCGGYTDSRETRTTCGMRYAPCCATHRFRTEYKRLCDFGIRQDKLLHVTIGFPSSNLPIRERKLHLDFVTAEFIRACKKARIPLRGIKIFDYADPNDPYLHYHLGLIQLAWLDFRRLMAIREKVIERTGQPFIVRVLGMRPKKALYRYFAMRAAGLFGHSTEKCISLGAGKKPLYYGFTLSEIIPFEKFLATAYRYRALTVVGGLRKGSSCIVGPVSGGGLKFCPKCGSEMTEISVEIHEDNVLTDNPMFIPRKKPPDPPKSGVPA